MCLKIKKKRPIQFTTENGELIQGKFHQWGSENVTSGFVTIENTIGICEDENGFVYKVDPGLIRFKD